MSTNVDQMGFALFWNAVTFGLSHGQRAASHVETVKLM
jgi:hypothetical protein